MPDLSEAIVVWTGFKEAIWPSRDAERLVRAYGAEAAAVVLPQLCVLEEDFYSSEANARIANLVEMGETAAKEFRVRHPEISDEAVSALTWCYTFDYK